MAGADPEKNPYRAKRIEAWELSAGKYADILAWCEADVQETDATAHTIDIGNVCAGIGDMIVKGLDGHFYVMRKSDFEALWEAVVNEPA